MKVLRWFAAFAISLLLATCGRNAGGPFSKAPTPRVINEGPRGMVPQSPGGAATIPAPNPLGTCQIKFDPPAISPGQTTTLTLIANNLVTSVTLNGQPATFPLTKTITPSATTNYVAVATASDGSSLCEGTIEVTGTDATAVSCSIATDVPAATAGSQVTLVMSTVGSPTSASLDGTSVSPAGDTKTVTLTQQSAFIGSVTGPGGSSYCGAEVQAAEPAVQTECVATIPSDLLGQAAASVSQTQINKQNAVTQTIADRSARQLAPTDYAQITLEGTGNPVGNHCQAIYQAAGRTWDNTKSCPNTTPPAPAATGEAIGKFQSSWDPATVYHYDDGALKADFLAGVDSDPLASVTYYLNPQGGLFQINPQSIDQGRLITVKLCSPLVTPGPPEGARIQGTVVPAYFYVFKGPITGILPAATPTYDDVTITIKATP